MTGERCEVCDRAECQREPSRVAARTEYTPNNAYAETMAQRECYANEVDWRARALAAEAERDTARETIAKLQGDRCTVCDEDGLIYVPVHGGEDADEEPRACPMCDGTRSGYASAITKERDAAMRVVEAARHLRDFVGRKGWGDAEDALVDAVTEWESQQKGESDG